jgi:putative iron-dependent peroxidase
MTNIELDADVKPSCSHSSLTTLEENGEEIKILRDEHVFQHLFDGRRAARITDKIGTKLAHTGLAERHVVAQDFNLLAVLFKGYDRLLDYSRPVPGSLFFVPSATLLEELSSRQAE